MLRYFTAGESHGRGIFCFLDGFPAGLELQPEDINFWLAERQKGYGRGGRMRIEKDEVDPYELDQQYLQSLWHEPVVE